MTPSPPPAMRVLQSPKHGDRVYKGVTVYSQTSISEEAKWTSQAPKERSSMRSRRLQGGGVRGGSVPVHSGNGSGEGPIDPSLHFFLFYLKTEHFGAVFKLRI